MLLDFHALTAVEDLFGFKLLQAAVAASEAKTAPASRPKTRRIHALRHPSIATAAPRRDTHAITIVQDAHASTIVQDAHASTTVHVCRR